MVAGSYLLLTVGMVVQDGDGNSLGHITDVVADEVADIFRGVVVSLGLFTRDVFVAGDHIVSVASDRATLDLTHEQLAMLPDAAELTVRTTS